MNKVSIVSKGVLFVAQPEGKVIAVLAQGPVGRAGADAVFDPLVMEDRMAFAKRTDNVNDSLTYKGEAVPGSLSSAPVWRICRITMALDDDIDIKWAGGSAAFDKVWDNRLSLEYV